MSADLQERSIQAAEDQARSLEKIAECLVAIVATIPTDRKETTPPVVT